MLTLKANFSRHVGTVLTGMVFMLPMAAHSQTAPALPSQEKALSRVREFCVAIGQPARVDVKASALLDAPSTRASASPPDSQTRQHTYWQPCWRIALQPDVQIAIAASTGIVSEYKNFALMDRDAADTGPPEQAISEKAIHLATAAIKATGQKEELALWGAQLFGANAQVASEQRWVVRWRRTIHGVPYHGQHASVLLNPLSGALEEIVLVYVTPPYAEDLAHLPVSREAAVKVATDYYAACGASLPFDSAHLEIVQPNTLLDGENPAEETDLSSHVAWVCRYTANGDTLDLWVDARTGALLGGETAQPQSLKPRSKLLKKHLHH